MSVIQFNIFIASHGSYIEDLKLVLLKLNLTIQEMYTFLY